MDTLPLEDAFCADDLLPFTATRSVLDIRMGILTFREKWAHSTARDQILLQARLIRYPWHIFQYNGQALAEDFALVTAGRVSQPIPSSVQAIEPAAIFIEAGARLHHCVLNAATGPIYIGRHTEIMEGSCIRGPFALCEGAVVK